MIKRMPAQFIAATAAFMLAVGGHFLTSSASAQQGTDLRIAPDAQSVLCFGYWSSAGKPAKKPPVKKRGGAPSEIQLEDPDKSGPNVTYAPGARQSVSPRSACLLRFKGDRVRCLGGKGPSHGQADVFLDGKLVKTIDAYAPEAAAGQVLFEQAGLNAANTHEVRLVIKREKNAKATGRTMIIEGFEVAEVVDTVQELRVAGAEEMAKIVAGQKAYLKPDQWKPVPYRASAPFSGVTLDRGPLRECFDLNIKYLNRWYEAKGGYKGNIKNIGWDVHLPASSEGRMLGGAGNTLRWGEREDMRAIVDAVVSVVKQRQTADGYCLPYKEETMKGGGGAWNDERRNYDRVHLTRGLIAASLAGNKDALPVMRRFYDWLYASPYSLGLLAGPYGGSSHNCNNGHEGSLLMYFSPVGKPDDLVAAERAFVQDFFIEASRKADPLSLCYYPYHTPHSYTLLAYKAWLDHYRATGAPKYIEAAKGAWQIVHDHYLHIGGTIAICEARGGSYPPDSYLIRHKAARSEKYKGGSHTGETCGSVFWTDINHRLLQLYPDEAKYADQIENEILNVMCGVQDPEGNIRYHSFLVENRSGATFQNTCCEVFAAPFFGRLPEFVYSVGSDGLYVNLYAPSSIASKQMTMKMTTDFPANGKVSIRVESGAGALHLRIPGWVTSDVPVNVNGSVAVSGKPGSYVTIDRAWKAGDTVTLELPMQFRTQQYTGMDQDPDHEMHALFYGPILMALVGADDLDVPVAELPGRLKPIAGQTLHFSVAGKDGVHYRPYWQVENEQFTCFPTMR